ncbi:beta-mannosidase [Pullulanibacillus camelliae]|uniref:Beta-mannosidase B n=1 Tax=Pullulanibacillus camelliae TaxID=1707096 RepID=A0A8J2VJX8_9BACL|nr:glycoside hydrolase family 2 protein [Pullulanibacillus camelliae]GGE26078.1 beta-mannosidase [Pullulanibacillus camelliae]
MTETNVALQDWTFKASDSQEWLPAQVPGCVHTDLLNNQQIPAPFYGTNERELQWIDKKDWQYRTTFAVSEDLLAHDRVELFFAGLDTYADVYLNGHKILAADNMFRSWRVDIKSLLKKEDNALNVYFYSPIHKGLVKLAQQGYDLPATNDVSEIGGIGDRKVSVFSRKAPYHFGWDWGPRFVTSGIWKPVSIQGWNEARITDLYIKQDDVTPTEALMTALVEVEVADRFEGMLQLRAEALFIEKQVALEQGSHVLEMKVAINKPKLWWSNGLGEQHLYTFTAECRKGNRHVSSRSVKTGLRSLKLVRMPDDSGSSFYFELNGRPVFAKGANHIPNDSFLSEVTRERYKYEILSAVAANMNMLRVWGGGIYEADAFYELCDEYGILIWQDFMFACSMYPGDTAFLENIRLEAEENIKRLRNHPSIALWCGNNEMDTAWSQYDEKAGWGWKEQYEPELREKIWQDYEAIFHRLLPETIERLAPGVDYWPSSPLQALTNNKEQHATNDSSHGDIHYWGVWHNVEPFENYNVQIGRFMSEYGFQSFPEERTVRTYAEEADMALESEVMLQHQKNGAGNRLIKEYMEQYFPEAKDFPSFLYMSQVQQAEAIKMAIEAHRRRMPYTMGSLYWQMNDCWPVASWSSMDYYGRWKALQYYAKNSFKEVILSVDGREERVDLYIVSDAWEDEAGQVIIKLLDFNGNVLDEWHEAVSIPANTSQKIWSRVNGDILGGHSAQETLLSIVLETNRRRVESKEHYFVPTKQLNLPHPTISLEPIKGTDGTQYRLATDGLAKQVWLSSEYDGVFSDNFFDLLPGIPKVVSFYQHEPSEEFLVPKTPGEIIVRSMTDFIL